MSKKTYRPKADAEGLTLTANIGRHQVDVDEGGNAVFDREPGEVFEVSKWPYTTENPAEIAYLDEHDKVTDRPAPKATADKKEK